MNPSNDQVVNKAVASPTSQVNMSTSGATAPSNTNTSTTTESKPSGKKRSWVWDHYTKGGEPKSRVGVCHYCEISIACKKNNGTTALINHLGRCRKYPLNSVPKDGQKTIEGVVVEKEGEPTGRKITTWMFDQERCRKSLAKMIIVDELPFNHVEKDGFRDFCADMQPKFKVPSRSTVTRDCYSLFLVERKRLKDFSKKLSSRVCLTTDTWTSCQNLNYMCLTAHFIDDDWKLCKRIINFCPISGHSGEVIGKAIESCLLTWDIERVFTITVDNAASNNVGIEYLKKRINSWKGSVLKAEFLHMRCVAHILGLIVKDGLSDLDNSIIRIRNAVKYVRSSASRLAKFKTCIEKEKIDSKSVVCLDVETRWNSTYLMLESALKFQKAFDLLEIQDSKYVEALRTKDENGMVIEGVPTDNDWDYARNLLPFLSIFYDATLKLSGSHYVTANEFMKEIFGIGMVISMRCELEDLSTKNMAKRMKQKHHKYWGNIDNINRMLFTVVVFDPHCKLKYVNFVIDKSYDEINAVILRERVNNLFSSMFDFYESSLSLPKDKSNFRVQSSCEMEVDCVKDVAAFLDEIFDKQEASQTNLESKNELEKYLGEDCEPKDKNFNVLRWWKSNSSKYHVLSSMARDVLAMPISTVASESAFSTGGRVLDSFRSCLTPKMVEALVCCQDWVRKSQTSLCIEEKLEKLEELEEIETDVSSCLTMEHPTVLFED